MAAELIGTSVTADERLEGARLKAKRAEHHIANVETEVAAFFASKPYVIGTKRDPKTRRLIYYMSRVEPPPRTLSLVVGTLCLI